jgi:hypothetical protein
MARMGVGYGMMGLKRISRLVGGLGWQWTAGVATDPRHLMTYHLHAHAPRAIPKPKSAVGMKLLTSDRLFPLQTRISHALACLKFRSFA